MNADITCPYCGEPFTLWVDETAGRSQRYVEDCAVCCQPIDVCVAVDGGEGRIVVDVRRSDD